MWQMLENCEKYRAIFGSYESFTAFLYCKIIKYWIIVRGMRKLSEIEILKMEFIRVNTHEEDESLNFLLVEFFFTKNGKKFELATLRDQS